MTEESTTGEKEFKVSGGELLGRFRDLVHQGNVRHIIIQNEKGRTLLEVPLTLGVVGVALIPAYAAVAAIAALVAKCNIIVLNTEDE
ncbi:MAG: hypothetical protein AVO35_09475 [Candidatus Aegiribacteria sp. MLS_C]|nr:MAG: hypothetical protein AVO35_09475 [Candidatus Aegiribacteria sp. MLS_C]